MQTAYRFCISLLLLPLLAAISQESQVSSHVRTALERVPFAAMRQGSDLLTIYYKNEEAEAVRLGGTFSLNMNGAESGIWTASFQLDDLESALFTFTLTPEPGGYTERYYYRGPLAPARVVKVDKLAGYLRHLSLRAFAFPGNRQTTVYLPPGRAEYVVFMGDGDLVNKLAFYIDPLIVSGELPPVALAGCYPAEGVIGEENQLLRSQAEYLEDISEESGVETGRFFSSHMAFFADEFIPRMIDEYNLPANRERHMLAGFSSSAAFAISLLCENRRFFKSAFLFSPIWKPALEKEPPAELPTIYLLYGSLEDDGNLPYQEFIPAWNARATTVNAGHDEIIWLEGFTRLLTEELKRNRQN